MEDLDCSTCENVIDCAHLNCLKYAIERGYTCTPATVAYFCGKNALDCAKHLLLECKCPADEEAPRRAAESGNLAILAYLHGAGVPWDESTVMAGLSNNFDCLKFAVDNGCPIDKCNILRYVDICDNQPDRCYYYLLSVGCEPHKRTKVSEAAY